GAVADSTQIVYGQTYTMPLAGTVGDVAVDSLRGNVFLSNKSHNRLEVWTNTTRTFDPNGITVGSQPWGMTTTALSPDSLLVANSGGTNISKVCIANCSGGAMAEDLAQRILTRGVYVFQVFESIVIRPKQPNTAGTDALFMYDHPPGSTSEAERCVVNVTPPVAPDPRSICVQSTASGIIGAPFDATIEAMVATMQRLGSDVEA